MEIIKQIVVLLLNLVPKEKFKEVVDTLLDKIETLVEDSETEIDDAIILPLVDKIRELLDVPDNDA